MNAFEQARLWRTTPMSSILVAANVVVFVLFVVAPRSKEVLGMPPDVATVANQPWSLITVAFTSANLLHLLVAVGVLVVVGMEVERLIGPGHLLAVYLLAGVVGSIALLAVASATGYSDISLGASAAFLGVLGAAAALPRSPALRQLQLEKVIAVIVIINVVGPVLGIGEWVSSAAHAAGLVVGGGYGFWRGAASRPAPSDSPAVRPQESEVP